MNAASSYFSHDYLTAANRFRETAAKAGARMESLPIEAKGPAGERLNIDIAWFGSDTPRRVLLHSSGLHGVEGFAGSAIQLHLINSLPSLPADSAIVMAHILNPYGMAWLRRVNENNVDLNRNFRSDGSYTGAPPRYARLHPFLNPETPPGFDFYFGKAAYFILRYGMAALKQSVAGGQYEFPRGLFFGGRALQEGPMKYREFLTARMASVEKAIVIDVHTGLGKFAEDVLLVDSRDYASLCRLFGQRVTAMQSDQGPAYLVQGGVEEMIFRVFANTRPIVIGQEFGTYSGIRVLRALREENRWHHYGEGGIGHATKQTLKETFCPADEAWRTSVLKRGQELLQEAMRRL